MSTPHSPNDPGHFVWCRVAFTITAPWRCRCNEKLEMDALPDQNPFRVMARALLWLTAMAPSSQHAVSGVTEYDPNGEANVVAIVCGLNEHGRALVERALRCAYHAGHCARANSQPWNRHDEVFAKAEAELTAQLENERATMHHQARSGGQVDPYVRGRVKQAERALQTIQEMKR